jgi:E3 ubiquitin-protein ligase makorin
MYDVLDMLSEVDLTSGEFYNIMRDSEFFDGMDPFEMMALSDSLAAGSGPCLGPFDSDDEESEFNVFRMAAMSEALASGVDDFGPDDFDDEFDHMDAAFLSMMMHSHIEDDDEDDEEEYSDDDEY